MLETDPSSKTSNAGQMLLKYVSNANIHIFFFSFIRSHPFTKRLHVAVESQSKTQFKIKYLEIFLKYLDISFAPVITKHFISGLSTMDINGVIP